MDLKRLCLANGDEYEAVQVEAENVQVFIDSLAEGDFIAVRVKGKSVYLNPEFIISFEDGGHKGLSVI